MNMNEHVGRRLKHGLYTSPWTVLGSVMILLVMVVVMAAQNYNREKRYMSRILSEKGAALIKGLEAGSRTGMMAMMWGGQQIQTLIEETALLPDVLYITIISQEGTVLASSETKIIGTAVNPTHFIDKAPSETISWQMIHTQNNQPSFEVDRKSVV